MFELPLVLMDRLVAMALEEDLASGDPTTEACVAVDAVAVAHATARQPLVACGWPVFARVFRRLDEALVAESLAAEGERVRAGQRLWTVRGRARSILSGERVALNFAQRLSGVATKTRAYVDAVPSGCATRITDTRKTTPGLRVLERYAVRVGGGHNCRDDLGGAILIKDNHVVASGGVAAAIGLARARASHTAKVQCEVDSLSQLEDALQAGVDMVLLDNMAPDAVAQAVAMVRRSTPSVLVEASGGVTLERIATLVRAGVDAISVGGLTHSAPAVDIGLDFE